MKRDYPRTLILLAVLLCGALSVGADPPPRTIRIAGLGALSGPVQSFGVNSRAAQRAAADAVNRDGGIRLADGSKATLEVSYVDDRCEPNRAIELMREIEHSNALLAIGPSCSSVAEPLFAALQHRAGDTADRGVQVPILTDGATKANLARISEWAFRNVADEETMYRALWAWVRQTYPDLRTVFGGEERDFAHSHSTWQHIIRKTAQEAGLTVVGETSWSLTDTQFQAPVSAIASSHSDIVVLSAHATTTCGVLSEMAKQQVGPTLSVGLTSSASDELVRRCGPRAEGLLIPTTFAPTTPAARAAEAATKAHGGVADLHSMAAWENVMLVKKVIEKEGIAGRPETIVDDRRKLRDGLARLAGFDGLLGPVRRTEDRESKKPYAFVQVRDGRWQIVRDVTQAAAEGLPPTPSTGSREEQFSIAGAPESLSLFLRHLPPLDRASRGRGRAVLFIHGATFPSALAAAYKFQGRSWMDDLSAAGFDVWALDFPGYGGSSRYPAMDDPATAHEALGRASVCAEQVDRAIEFIARHEGVERVSIVAHSWATTVAGAYASQRPDRLGRLVFFGAIATRHETSPQSTPAWQYVTSDYQWNRFQGEIPHGEAPLFPHREYDPWIAAYLATDPFSAERTPPSVKVPSGPFADISAAWSGTLPYEPSRITAPVLLVRGEWDTVSSADDVRWLFGALTRAAEKQAVTLDHGTHQMHLESGRHRLYRAVEHFLLSGAE